MNNSFSLQQISKPGCLDSNLISRQYKINLMAKFMQNKFENPKLKHSEMADQLCYSSSTLKRYRKDISMVSPYKRQPNINNEGSNKVSNKNIDNNLHREHERKRRQMSSNDFKVTLKDNDKAVSTEIKSKNNLKAGNRDDVNHSNGRNLIEQALFSQ